VRDVADKRLVVDTLVSSLAGACLLLALVSWAAQLPAVWGMLSGMQRAFASLAPAHQHKCWLCGMSRAFVALWRGDAVEATMLNPNAPWLFGAMLSGVAMGLVYWLLRSLTTKGKAN
jgi:hypothetical protein